MTVSVQEVESYEGKLSKLSSQLDAQYELCRAADRKTKRAEADLLDMEQKLRQLECSSFTSSDNAVIVERDKVSQCHYLLFY